MSKKDFFGPIPKMQPSAATGGMAADIIARIRERQMGDANLKAQQIEAQEQIEQARAEQAQMETLRHPGHPVDGDHLGIRSFTLWGRQISEGSELSDEERSWLQIIAQNPAVDIQTHVVVSKILAAEPKPSILQPVSEPELPAELADEMTVRAREALIASGDFPGGEFEAAIRSGMMDDLSGVRTAIQVLRDMGQPIAELRKRQTGERQHALIPLPEPEPTLFGRFGRWLEHLQHRFVRLWSHYEQVKARNLALAGTLAMERRNHVKQMDLLEKKAATDQQDLKTQVEALKVEQTTLRDHIAQVEEQLHRAKVELGRALLKEVESRRDPNKVPHGGTCIKSPMQSRVAGTLSDSEQEQALAQFLQTTRPDERAALLELAKHALASRRIDPNTDQIVLSMKVPKLPLRK